MGDSQAEGVLAYILYSYCTMEVMASILLVHLKTIICVSTLNWEFIVRVNKVFGRL